MDSLVLIKRTGKDMLAVKQQVDREALEVWGKRAVEPFQTIPPLMPEKPWSITSLYAFGRSILP